MLHRATVCCAGAKLASSPTLLLSYRISRTWSMPCTLDQSSVNNIASKTQLFSPQIPLNNVPTYFNIDSLMLHQSQPGRHLWTRAWLSRRPGGSYIPTPLELVNKQGIINVKNTASGIWLCYLCGQTGAPPHPPAGDLTPLLGNISSVFWFRNTANDTLFRATL